MPLSEFPRSELTREGVVRNMATKRELEEENATLREKLEEIYDLIGDALGFDDNEESEDIESEADEA